MPGVLPGGRPKDRRRLVPRPHAPAGQDLYTVGMPIHGTSRRRSLFSLLLSLPLLAASAYAQFDLQGVSSAGLRLSAAAVPAASAPSAQLAAETYPDREQDRKPASLVSDDGTELLLAGVRFDRDPATGVYDWNELRIRPDRLREVYWGYRSGGVGHTFMLFRFDGGAWDRNGRPVEGVVIEALGWKAKGEKYSPFGGGLSGRYPLIWNVGTWDSFLQTAIGRDGARADVYPLKISRDGKLAMLRLAVREATRDLGGEKYNTFLDSCSSNALKVFSGATGHHLVVGKMLPAAVVEHMKLRGFLGPLERNDSSNWRP